MFARRWWKGKGAPAAPALSLALQGGGAHGAYTWGVLDRLLEDDWRLDGISGTSAGAMNAVALADGWVRGGAEGARESLAGFWEAVADSTPFELDLLHSLNGASDGSLPGPMNMMLGLTRLFSPYQLNPFDLNPLRDIVAEQFDFARLRRESPVRLFIAATHANTGQLRLFRNAELSADALLASACLPTIHRTVVIDGEPYWDGGYSANPAVFPLAWECSAADLLLILLTPLRFAETPGKAQDIRDRLRELSFNATFLREMRSFAHLREQISPSRLPGWLLDRLPQGKLERRLSALRFHAISAEHVLGGLPADSKLAVNRPFFEQLRDEGRAHARRWLEQHRPSIGRNASLDLANVFY